MSSVLFMMIPFCHRLACSPAAALLMFLAPCLYGRGRRFPSPRWRRIWRNGPYWGTPRGTHNIWHKRFGGGHEVQRPCASGAGLDPYLGPERGAPEPLPGAAAAQEELRPYRLTVRGVPPAAAPGGEGQLSFRHPEAAVARRGRDLLVADADPDGRAGLDAVRSALDCRLQVAVAVDVCEAVLGDARDRCGVHLL